jgi:hypothetical protein
MAQAAKLAPAPKASAEADTPNPVPPKNLAAALLEAQRAIGAVAKGSTNEYDRYQYTSSDTMIAACRDALHSADLLFDREGWRIDRTVEPNELVSKFALEYPATGERREYEVEWPIVPNQKRLTAVDKARAGALTTSIGYFLRDLLQVPRADPNEMDRREDRDEEPPQAKPTDASRTLQAEVAAAVGLLRDKRHVQTAGTYLDRAGHDVKLLRQVKNWIDQKVAEQSAPAAGDEVAASVPATSATPSAATPSAGPELVDPETGEALDPESPLFGRGGDGP